MTSCTSLVKMYHVGLSQKCYVNTTFGRLIKNKRKTIMPDYLSRKGHHVSYRPERSICLFYLFVKEQKNSINLLSSRWEIIK